MDDQIRDIPLGILKNKDVSKVSTLAYIIRRIPISVRNLADL